MEFNAEHGWSLPNNNMVSIIVPVYNTIDYLPDCMASLLSQTYTNLEIVLVDDGSTDGSSELCDHYSKIDERVFTIHRNNGGLSSARNMGTSVAHGDWITYIDSDDAVSPRYIEYLLTTATENKVPLVACKFKLFDKAVPEDEDLESRVYVMSGSLAASEVLSEKRASTAAWGKLATADLWKSVSFPEGRRFEDLPVTWMLFDKANKAALVSSTLYYYRKRVGSISSSSGASLKSIEDYATSIHQMLRETSASIHAGTFVHSAAFRAALESCRLYEMCECSPDKHSQPVHLIKESARQCVKNNIFNALMNGRAPVFQRLRILVFYISPRLSMRLLHFGKKTWQG